MSRDFKSKATLIRLRKPLKNRMREIEIKWTITIETTIKMDHKSNVCASTVSAMKASLSAQNAIKVGPVNSAIPLLITRT